MSNDSRSELWRAARSYVDKGFSIIPIRENTSRSFYSEWKWSEKCISDVEAVDSWWSKHPNDNIAILTGSRSKKYLLVIDLDVKEGKNGLNVLYEWEKKHEKMPPTLVVKTPHDGFHKYYYLTKEQLEEPLIKSATDIYGEKSGVDIRCEGGIIVAPPSKTPDGVYKKSKDRAIAFADETVLDFILNAPDYDKKSKMKEKRPIGLDAEIETISAGSRNDSLFRTACRLRDLGLSSDAVLEAVWKENETKCQPPLSRHEVMTLVSSALSYGRLEDSELSEANELEFQQVDNDMITLTNVEPKEMEWLIDDLIPKNNTVLIGADGGTGKSYFWMSLFASLSAGKPYFFCDECPEPQKVMFFSSEDQLETVVVPRLLKMGANMDNIITINEESEHFSKITFNSKLLEYLISKHRPSVVCFDPLQSFVGTAINMGAQNQMRNMLQPLKRLEKLYGVTFIVICHTNKARRSYDPRDRLANSGDIWDIARCVIMMGRDLDGHIFVSKEKGNYSKENHYSFLYDIVDGVPQYYMDTDKRYYDFEYDKKNHEPDRNEGKETKKEMAERLIISFLKESAANSIPSKVLKQKVMDAGVSSGVYNTVRASLVQNKVIQNETVKEGEKRTNYTTLIDIDF